MEVDRTHNATYLYHKESHLSYFLGKLWESRTWPNFALINYYAAGN